MTGTWCVGRTWRPATAADRREPSPSKMGNKRTVVDGITWDSKLEAAHYQKLRMLVAAGAIAHLRWKVKFPLYTVNWAGVRIQVATYIADFTYTERGKPVVEDTKGFLTPMYRLKRKWLREQEGIEIREVYAKPARRR